MHRSHWALAVGALLAAASAAQGQVVGGVMAVTQSHMSWWGGVARDATARQYDVDADAVRLDVKTGEITFRAKKGRLVDLDKLHESIRATRLGVGTGMALNWLEVTAAGEVVAEKERLVLKVKGSDQTFVLKEGDKTAFAKLRDAVKGGQKSVSVSGRVDGWEGKFPPFLKALPKKPREILVKSFEPVKAAKP